eukprot:Em0009g1186a
MHYKILYANFGVALSIWTILSLIQCHPSKLRKWTPGVAIPINAIHTSPHRMVYLLAFSAVSGDLLSLILDRKPLFDYGIDFTHYSTAIATRYILGIISVPLLILRQVLVVTSFCSYDNSTDFWIQLALVLPIMLCLCAQFIWFCWRLVWTLSSPIRGGPSLRAALFEHKATTYHVCRVKSLLEGACLKGQGSHDPHLFIMCLSHAQHGYKLTLQASYDTIFVAVEMGVYLRGNNSLVEEMRKADFIGGLLLGLVYTVEVVLPVAPIIAFMWNLVNLMLWIHIQKIARGDLSFVASVPSPTFRLVNSMKYTSYQIAYYVWSWLLVWFLASLAGVLGYIGYFLVTNYTEQILLSVATAVKLFHVFSYFLFFHNIIIGLGSSLLRIILGMFFWTPPLLPIGSCGPHEGIGKSRHGSLCLQQFSLCGAHPEQLCGSCLVDVVRAAVKERAARECTTQEDLPVVHRGLRTLAAGGCSQRCPPDAPAGDGMLPTPS